jgi:hypothetical protein
MRSAHQLLVKCQEKFQQANDWSFGAGGALRDETLHLPIGKGGKGKGKGEITVPMDGPLGPLWIEEGWVHGYKVFIGDLPGTIGKMDLAHCTKGQVDLAINANATRSGMAYSIATVRDLGLAVECFQQASAQRFDTGQGVMHWASVKWFRGKKA